MKQKKRKKARNNEKMSDMAYTRLSSASVQENKNLVISSCSKGGYTIAQQVSLLEGDGKRINVFLKGAMHIASEEGLINLRDALNIAIDKIHNN